MGRSHELVQKLERDLQKMTSLGRIAESIATHQGTLLHLFSADYVVVSIMVRENGRQKTVVIINISGGV